MTGYEPMGRYFEVENGQLYGHVREGTGSALVFLHYWGGLAPHLAARHRTA